MVFLFFVQFPVSQSDPVVLRYGERDIRVRRENCPESFPEDGYGSRGGALVTSCHP